MWEENNVFDALRLTNESVTQRVEDALIDQYNSTTSDQYDRIFADWDRWGDEFPEGY